MCTQSMVIRFALIALTALALLGCDGNSNDGSATASSGSGQSAQGSFDSHSGNAEADKALMAKIQEHWVKTDNGWTTELVEQLPLNPPVRVLKQYRDFRYTLESETLTEADRLNGIEWKAWADFGTTSMRYWREEDNFEYPKGWSKWSNEAPFYRPAVFKRNGQWIVDDPTLGSMFEGVRPADVPAS